jgi:hypothetical protein
MRGSVGGGESGGGWVQGEPIFKSIPRQETPQPEADLICTNKMMGRLKIHAFLRSIALLVIAVSYFFETMSIHAIAHN